ncbi:non-ribosomal peptide synthetase [Algoriphagus halophilus]|uniref:Amino acid adenylation domain-containing protein n=1 Tax=Algoriphagus halophilus TaxID=226505 RepID=A0A1N6DU22_9BACT|nr:non-ribosomal peptide synthetase [Algoriphagus halophilus]SIN74207.1 amino acid adenylation domain-containing protein [Algoriphagus halophilus]
MEGNSDDLLDQWLNFNEQEQGSENLAEERIPKASLSDHYPLSVAQQRLWFVYQKNPESPVYNYSEIWNFHGSSFDQGVFSKALESLVAKHQILASNYVVFQEEPVMVFRRGKSFDLHFAKDNQDESDARNWLKNLASEAFRLETDPLIRVGVCHLNDQYLIGITFHHIIIDAWSMGILREDFADFYVEISNNNQQSNFSVPENDLQYQDYTSWQRELPESESKSKSIPTPSDSFLDLPLDFPRPASPSYQGSIIRFSLPKNFTDKVGKLVKDFQTTDFNLFLACFQILLGRYAKSEQVTVGIPVFNRDKEEFKSMVGYFVDTQVIEASLEKQKLFSELLKEIKNDVLAAISTQKPSYEELVSNSQTAKDQSYNPLFQAMFVGHSAGENPFQNHGLSVDFEVLDLEVSKFDLTLHHFGLKAGAYQIGIEISRDLFSPVFAERLCQHFTTLLEGVCENPNLEIESYSLISEEENQFLVSGLSHGFLPEGNGTVLTEILDSLIQKKDQIAVVCGSERLSYGELDLKSQVIAYELGEKSADPNYPIGIFMERSVDYLVSILAILRFGGVYLPLDPDYPDQRTLQYLKESGANFVLTHRNCIDSKDSVKDNFEIINIDLIEYNQSIENQVNKGFKFSNNAYLIFTSGSTNKPKGVLVSHNNLYSSVAARKSYYQESPTSFLLASSFSFDSSVAGIFWSLCTGGKLIITQQNETLDTAALSAIIAREDVSHTLMLPSLYQALLQENDRTWDALKGVILAGEEFPNDLIKMHFEKHPTTRLFNEYGPTEGTVWCTVQELHAGDSFHRVPIGLATSNTLAYVLDSNQKLSPIGIPGELCIAGAGLTNGYLSEEDTASKFLKNPYSEEWNRVYRTGDLVRIQKDGLLEYLGREDNQVKIRGHRVELTEIQDLALRDPKVKSALAIVGGASDTQIIVAIKSDANINEGELDGFFRQNLPRYMVPDIILILKEFPLLPNGKVDLNALNDIAIAKPNASTVSSKIPSTYLERQVAGIWADVMGEEEVPVNKDFYEMGGNSLQSIRIIARCRDIGIKVTPAQFLRYSTVESLVKSIHHEAYQRPENTLELEVLKVWETFLKQKLIGVKDSFQKNGGSDFEWKQVENELNSIFTFKDPIHINDSIQDISKKILANNHLVEFESINIRRVIPIKTTGQKSPLFCIHSEFYYETVYSQLTRHMPAEYPVYGILSVSPELIKNSVPRNIEEIASLCLEEIRLIQPKGPYRILSYSIGNVVAFEIAKQMLEAGEQVNLIMIDPPLFFDKSRTFGKGGYKKLFTYLDYWKNPGQLLEKVRKKVRKDPKPPVLIQDTGLLKKYLLSYKPEKIACDTLLITTPREFKHTYEWDPLLNIVDREKIQGPHLKLMREPYAGQLNEAIVRNLKKWDEEKKTMDS